MLAMIASSRLVCGFMTRNVVGRFPTAAAGFKRGRSIDIDGVDESSSDDGPKVYHVPVLLKECCEYLGIKQDGIYVDCTLGGGGHTLEIMKRGGRVIGLDQDPDAIAKTSADLATYIETGRLEIIQTNFRYIERAIRSSKFADGKHVDGILMDLGISSHQIDEPSRGFAFGADGPLDMRMGQGVCVFIMLISMLNTALFYSTIRSFFVP